MTHQSERQTHSPTNKCREWWVRVFFGVSEAHAARLMSTFDEFYILIGDFWIYEGAHIAHMLHHLRSVHGSDLFELFMRSSFSLYGEALVYLMWMYLNQLTPYNRMHYSYVTDIFPIDTMRKHISMFHRIPYDVEVNGRYITNAFRALNNTEFVSFAHELGVAMNELGIWNIRGWGPRLWRHVPTLMHTE